MEIRQPPKPSQPSGQLFVELREDIRLDGILEPLLVQHKTNGLYTIIDGYYRYQAALELGITQLPIQIATVPPPKKPEL
jgi:ParB-like chromosome segregation protein Spo0J